MDIVFAGISQCFNRSRSGSAAERCEQAKTSASSGASKTFGPSSERDFGVRPSAKRRMSTYVQNYYFDRNSDLPARV